MEVQEVQHNKEEGQLQAQRLPKRLALALISVEQLGELDQHWVGVFKLKNKKNKELLLLSGKDSVLRVKAKGSEKFLLLPLLPAGGILLLLLASQLVH